MLKYIFLKKGGDGVVDYLGAAKAHDLASSLHFL
jgi:hypothetical protein